VRTVSGSRSKLLQLLLLLLLLLLLRLLGTIDAMARLISSPQRTTMEAASVE